MLKSNLEKIIVFNVLLNVNLVICLPKSHFSSYPRIKDFGDDEHPIIISSAHQQLYHNEPFQFKRLPTTTKQPFLSRLPVMASDNYQDDKNLKTHSWVNVSVLPLTSRPLIITGPSTSSTTTTTTTTSTPRPVPRPTPRSTTTTTTTSTTTTTPSPSLVSSTTQSTVNKLSKPTKGVVRSELDLNTSSSQSNASIAHPLANQVDGPSASSFIQPLTLLIMSYLANKKINSLPIDRYSHGLPPPPTINSSFYDTSNRNQNDTETESRTIASWFGGLARRLKRPKHPNRRDHTVGPGRGSIPIPYETAPISLASLHGPSLATIGRPLSGSSSDPIMLPGLLPQPEGFPGPFNPENSVLLPPDIMENSGIKYWLDFIEKGGTTDDLTPAHLNGSPAPLPPQLSSAHSTPPLGHQTIFEAAGSDHDEVDFNNAIKRRFKRPPAQAKPDGNRQNTRYRPNQHRPSNGAANGNGNSNGNGNQIDSHIQKNSYGETSDSYDGTDRNGNSNSLHYHEPDRHKQNEMSPRCDKFTDHICVDDFEYPEQAIVDEIYKRRDIFELMYSEVKGNIPLVDGIPRDVEESYSYETDETNDDTDENDDSPGDRNDVSNDERADPMYSAANSDSFAKSAVGRQGLRPGVSNKENSNSQNGNGGSKDASHGGYVCPSEVLYGKPKLARNIKGDWKVIVNAAEFTQTVRMEKCLRPNQRCNYVSNIGIVSRCAQVHSFHRLMVFEKGKGFYIDTFQIPTACSCHIRRTGGPTVPSPMSDLLGLNDSPGSGGSNGVGSNGNGGGSSNGNGIASMGKSPTPLQLSNALWSILGSGSGSPSNNGQSLSGNPFSVIDNINSVNNDLLKAQLSVLSSIKNYPSLTGSISPESVLQQLTSQSDAIQNIQGLTNAFNQNSGFPSMNGKQPDSGNHNDQTVEYLLPGMMYAEEPLSFQEHSDNLGQRLHSSHSTGSFSRGSSPTSSSHSLSSSGPGTGEISTGGAPLVQVIHVPVSSHPLSPQLQRHHGPSTTNLQFPVYNKPSTTSNDLPTLTAYASASKSSADALKAERKPSAYFSSLSDTDRNKVLVNRASENNNSNNENKTNATSTYDSAVLTSTPKVAIAGASNSHVIHPQETSTQFDKNDPTNEPTAINENNSKDSNNNNNDNDKSDSTGKTFANSITDGKVNFSYHPILEYIMPSQSSS